MICYYGEVLNQRQFKLSFIILYDHIIYMFDLLDLAGNKVSAILKLPKDL